MKNKIAENKLLMLFIVRNYWKIFDVQTKTRIRSVIEKALAFKPRPGSEQRYICNDVWFDVFEFLSRAELGNLMAQISERFDALVDNHYSTIKWMSPNLTFSSLHFKRAKDGTGAVLETSKDWAQEMEVELVPMNSIPFQRRIKQFGTLAITYIDRTVIAFLHSIKHAFSLDNSRRNSFMGVVMGNDGDQWKSWDVFIKEICPLLPMADCHFYMRDHYNSSSSSSSTISVGFPAFVLDCAEFRKISTAHCPMAYCSAADTEDAQRQAATNLALFNWLHLPRADGRPKAYRWCSERNANESINQLKEKFVNDTSPANYFVLISKSRYHAASLSEDEHMNNTNSKQPVLIFSMENEKTNEFMRLYAQRKCLTLIRNQKCWDWQKPKKEVQGRMRKKFLFFIDDKRIDLD